MLESLTKQIVDKRTHWELIVVDNGSTDDTAAVIEGFKDRLPIRRAWQPIAGLSHARNCAVAEAKGEYIIWTDDDVDPAPGWLASYIAAFEEHPDAAVFGGPIIPLFVGANAPIWFASKFDVFADALAVRDFGEEPRELDAANNVIPYGANFSVRAAEQRLHQYDPNLGVTPLAQRVGEETELIRRVLAVAPGRWVPKALVRHIIEEDRQNLTYLQKYYFSQGQSWAYTHLSRLPPHHLRIIVFRLGLAKLFHHLLARLQLFGRHPSRAALHHIIKANVYRGALSYFEPSGNRK